MKFSISKYLKENGWRLHLGWWYKPVPGWRGMPAPYQELFGTARAFDLQRKTNAGVDLADPVDEYLATMREYDRKPMLTVV